MATIITCDHCGKIIPQPQKFPTIQLTKYETVKSSYTNTVSFSISSSPSEKHIDLCFQCVGHIFSTGALPALETKIN